MSEWWLCPLGQCTHGAVLHDGDGYDEPLICCAEGCTCRGSLPELPDLVVVIEVRVPAAFDDDGKPDLIEAMRQGHRDAMHELRTRDETPRVSSDAE